MLDGLASLGPHLISKKFRVINLPAGLLDAERKATFLSHRTLIAKTPEEFKYDVPILEYQGWNCRCVDRVSACRTLQGSFSPRLLI